ncbi:MAG: PqiC family protein [Desulfobacterales bacterium]
MMKKSRIIRIAYLVLIVGVMMLTACGRTPPAKFYTLQPVEQSSMGRSMPGEVALAVGPVAIPAAIDRAEIVTREAGNEVSFSEYHRWAGPLKQSIASVMAQNIGTLLATERVTPFSRENIFQPTHRVVVNINRYDSQLSKEFLLDATWSIKDLGGNKLLLVQNSIIRESLASSTYEGLVAAQSKALAALSQKIAAALLDVVP